MSSIKHRLHAIVSPDVLEDEFESLRNEFHARLQRERLQLTVLAAALTRSDGDSNGIFESLRQFAHRMHGAAAIFESTDVANAAHALERASVSAVLANAGSTDPSVWTALVTLVDMLATMNSRRASVSTDFL
jgi:HPt (histidine-containing phosphotransfer) domain-containing protein